jgi:hypothetical protein
VRWPLYALPVAVVVVVAFALVTAGSTLPYRAARVWGGPTDAERLSLRLEVFEVTEDLGGGRAETVVGRGKVAVQLRAGRLEAARRVELDVEGGAEVAFDLGGAVRPLELSVEGDGSVLAAGTLALDAARWAAAARRRGGWSELPVGPYTLRVAPARGVLAVPFEEELWLDVLRGALPVANALVTLEASGARVSEKQLRTDARGRVVFRVAPEEHLPTARVRILDGTVEQQTAFGLAVVPGALRVTQSGRELLVEAPVPRDLAYFALVTPNERLLGGRLLLKPDGRGGSSARLAIPGLAVTPTHAVVASERDLRSTAAVGWPLEVPAGGEPARSFDAVEALLLDGGPRAVLRERARRHRVRWIVAAFVAAASLLELALLLALTRRGDRALDAHLERAGLAAADAERLAPRRSPAILLALLAVAVGFLVLALVAILRMR